jgi:hypothetical protein
VLTSTLPDVEEAGPVGENDTVSRIEQPRSIRIVVKFPQFRGKVLRNELQTCPGRIEDR